MLPDENNSHNPEKVPYFQQLQMQFTAHIRDPENAPYQPQTEKQIEPRRLQVYAELFFNNLYGLFSQVFPVCKQVLGESRWREICREYMIKHQAQTPLFHQLAEEFLEFLQSEFTAKENDPQFLLELAHYEWVELALAVSEEQEFLTTELAEDKVNLNQAYELSPLAWPLAYEWPVHQISEDYIPQSKPEQVTTLLVYRNQDSSGNERVDFMELTPMLYQWLMVIPEAETAQQALNKITQGLEVDEQTLQQFAQQTLHSLLTKAILQPV